ncbi:metal-dependent hydrolase [Sediminibacillus albus]|uniref:Inner membrane protein n=1 Tax=Sediminibacillus albus TaxID=407036 RepID=A0A1G9AJE9_9BACI|nr:metal-dependent hydrolase [Sediminibacillus albus]SDK27496.1 inner membrane protein [Sediminibacillus albus]
MTGKTHVIGGIAACMAVSQVTDHEPVLLLAAGVFGALLPDICHGGSKLGRKVPALSRLINGVFGHRTFTHSLLFLLLIRAAFSFVHWPAEISEGILVGIGSHLILDAATKNGIKLFYPINLTVRFPVTVRTGGSAESGILAVLVVCIVYFGRGIIQL